MGQWQNGKPHGSGTLYLPKTASTNKQAAVCGVDSKAGEKAWGGPWQNGKSCHGNKCCWFLGPDFDFYTASQKYNALGKQFSVLPMSRVVTTYEKNLGKLFSTHKIKLNGHSEDFNGYTKDLGHFDVT